MEKINCFWEGFSVLDFFFILLYLRICYVAISKGFFTEVFKTISLFCATILSLHFYTGFQSKLILNIIDWLRNSLPFIDIRVFYFSSFLIIFLGVGMVFSLLRGVFIPLIARDQSEGNSYCQRWISFFLANIRWFVIVSVSIFVLWLSPLTFSSCYDSLSYRFFKNVAVKVYFFSIKIWGKFNPDVEVNKEVKGYYEIKRSISESSN